MVHVSLQRVVKDVAVNVEYPQFPDFPDHPLEARRW